MIFRRFYTPGEVEGTGIGLFMIKRLIEDKGGMPEHERASGYLVHSYIDKPLTEEKLQILA